MAYKMKLFLIALSVAVLVTGCASTDTKYVTRVETVTVYKPVYTPPKELQDLKPIKRPDIATNHLKKEDVDRPGHVAKLVVETIAQLRSYAEELEGRINTYEEVLSKPSEPLPENTTTVDVVESDKPFEDQ